MSNQDLKQQNQDNEQGFPIQLKLLVTVIAFGVIVMVLKAIGIF